MTRGQQVVRVIKRHTESMLEELDRLLGESVVEARAAQVANIESGTQAPTSSDHAAIPADWTLIGERAGERYSWPGLLEEYVTFKLYEGTSPLGATSQYAVGECARAEVWGRDRRYFIVFLLGAGGGSKQPIVEFVETDDAAETREFVAIIRGKGGPRGQQMFGPGDDLPEPYQGMRIEIYRDRIEGTPSFGSWNKYAVVARENEPDVMCRHAAIQVALRHSR